MATNEFGSRDGRADFPGGIYPRRGLQPAPRNLFNMVILAEHKEAAVRRGAEYDMRIIDDREAISFYHTCAQQLRDSLATVAKAVRAQVPAAAVAAEEQLDPAEVIEASVRVVLDPEASLRKRDSEAFKQAVATRIDEAHAHVAKLLAEFIAAHGLPPRA